MKDLKLISLASPESCTGCGACAAACPKACISMSEDQEGFAQPIIDGNLCVSCGKCMQVCSKLNEHILPLNDVQKGFAARNRNIEERRKSSSGSISPLLCRAVLNKDGVVVGVGFDDSYEVVYKIIEKEEDLYQIQGSKYVQCRPDRNVFIRINQELKNNRPVLFIGTACQIEGLKHFLGKDYENLFCVDLICIGIPSPGVWRKYLKAYYPNEKIQHINFKHKMRGWHHFTVYVETDTTVHCSEDGAANRFMQSMFRTFSVRRSCFNCPFRTKERSADITLADCWGAYNLVPEMDDNQGLSSVIVHTQRGMDLWKSIDVEQKVIPLEDIIDGNPNMVRDITPDYKNRDLFYRVLKINAKWAFESYCTNLKGFIFAKKSLLLRPIKELFRTLQVRKWFMKSFWVIDRELFNERYTYDMKLNTVWFQGNMTDEVMNLYEIRYLKAYRMAQAAKGTVWEKYYFRKLKKLSLESGIGLYVNLNINHGLVIGHAGPIIMNSGAIFNGNVMITHGVTVGRDIRGKRAGVPTFGNNVVLRTNSVITGNITIGDDVLIAPDTFVNFDVPSHSVVIGNPATIHHKDNATQGHIPTLD